MEKEIKIAFKGQSKSVVEEVSIKYHFNDEDISSKNFINNEDILKVK